MTIVSCKLPMLAGVLFLRIFQSRPWQPCGKPGNASIVDLDQRIIDQQACGANGDAGRRRLILEECAKPHLGFVIRCRHGAYQAFPAAGRCPDLRAIRGSAWMTPKFVSGAFATTRFANSSPLTSPSPGSARYCDSPIATPSSAP